MLNIYLILIRASLIILAFYHIFKRQNKLIIQACAAFALTFLPGFLETAYNIRLDFTGRFLYVTIIMMTVYLGSGLKFYDKYKWWDRLIHLMSGAAFVSLGIALSPYAEGLSVFHILFFSFTLSVTLHMIWEVLEYLYDCVFHTDNQRWQKVNATINHLSESAIQPAGLVDTMTDSIMGIVGAAVSCIIWWFVL